jgi:phage regulator Rha-like protein
MKKKKYENQLQEIRPVGFEIRVGTRGGTPISFCYLDEEQATFLVTLMKNSEPVVKFKYRLSREFHRMKKEITRIQAVARNNSLNIEWTEAREAGKPTRRQETDVLKQLVAYAIADGSTNAHRYYGIYSRMANEILFNIQQKAGNLRDVCNAGQLGTLRVVDRIIERSLLEGMATGVHYRKIYKDTKQKVIQFAELFGKTDIPGNLQLGI